MSTAWRTPLLAITSKRTIKALPSFDFTWKGREIDQLQNYIQETKNQMATRNSPGNKEICQKPDTHNSIKRWQWEKIPKETNQMLAINTSREAEKWAKNEIHLDKFVSRGWDLLSSSSLEVGHTRWDILALPSKWWKLWWFYDSADFFFDNENNFKCTCILVPGTTCLRRIFERAALSPSNRYICSFNIIVVTI